MGMPTFAAQLFLLFSSRGEGRDRSWQPIQEARLGNRSAFESLIKGHEKRVYNLAFRMLRNHEDAEDIVQEAFLKAFAALPKLRDDKAFSFWLCRIASNLCLAKLREKKAAGELTLDSNQMADLPRERQDWDEHQEKAEIRKLVSQLPAKYRLAIVAFYLEGASCAEAAKLANISVRAFKTRLFRAREMLKQMLTMATEQNRGLS
jgi:RNA polymerase sigma-70 factor (ECF subfamily)